MMHPNPPLIAEQITEATRRRGEYAAAESPPMTIARDDNGGQRKKGHHMGDS